MFPPFLFLIWFLFSLVPVLEKKANGESGGVSIVPGFPVFPLVAWGLAAILDSVHDNLGYYVIGGLHAVLLACVIGFSVKYLCEIRRKRPAGRDS